jgi:hypothetical protein
MEIVFAFLVSALSLWGVKKIMGKGILITNDAIFAVSALYTLLGLIVINVPWGLIVGPTLHLPFLLVLELAALPALMFIAADKFIDGFNLKAKKYLPKAIVLFVLITFAGVILTQFLSFLGFGLFCGSGYSASRSARPYWFYNDRDYFYYG